MLTDHRATKDTDASPSPRSKGKRVAVVATAVGAAAGAAVLVGAAPWAVTSSPPDVVASGEGTVPFQTDSGSASCYQLYSPETLPDATFAFSGTVTTIDTGGPLFTDSMTFSVDEWFRGDDAAEVTLPMPTPAEPGDTSFRSGQHEVPSVTVGTRLLVAGSSRSGAPGTEDPIPWATCDFVRYYDQATAQVWAAALT